VSRDMIGISFGNQKHRQVTVATRGSAHRRATARRALSWKTLSTAA